MIEAKVRFAEGSILVAAEDAPPLINVGKDVRLEIAINEDPSSPGVVTFSMFGSPIEHGRRAWRIYWHCMTAKSILRHPVASYRKWRKGDSVSGLAPAGEGFAERTFSGSGSVKIDWPEPDWSLKDGSAMMASMLEKIGWETIPAPSFDGMSHRVTTPTPEETREFIDRRHRFVAGYCREQGWDPAQLTMDQIMKIRRQPGWKDAGGKEETKD